MKRFDLPKYNLNPNFIGSWTLSPLSTCDELISYFESNKKIQRRGASGIGINKNIKNSTDIVINPNYINIPGNDVFRRYAVSLFECYKDYIAQWPFVKILPNNLQIGSFNIQRYESGQHFQKIHTERGGLNTLHRVFAWMTYLNDVESKHGGSTVFVHYDLEIQPQKGLTLIWPAEWTHAHKGNLLSAGSKYIITGWIDFPPPKNMNVKAP